MTPYEKVSADFRDKRTKAAEAAMLRQRKAHAAIPALAAIDAELENTAGRIMAQISRGTDGLSERLHDIELRNRQLIAQRAVLLSQNGFPADFVDEQFECPLCKDSGYIGTRMCECFRKAICCERYLQSGLGRTLENMSFDTINPSYACGKAENGVTPRQKLEENMQVCRVFAANVAVKPQYLLMYGGTGLGKTHMTAAVCRAAVDAGCSVIYDSIQAIIRAFWNSIEEASEKYLTCDLLAIDDFGTEFINSHSMSVIYNILNTRMLDGKSMLINSNLDIKEFEKRYNKRINSRIFGSFAVIRFFGEDVRKLKAADYKV